MLITQLYKIDTDKNFNAPKERDVWKLYNITILYKVAPSSRRLDFRYKKVKKLK